MIDPAAAAAAAAGSAAKWTQLRQLAESHHRQTDRQTYRLTLADWLA